MGYIISVESGDRMRELTKEERIEYFNKNLDYITKQSQDYVDYARYTNELFNTPETPVPTVEEMNESARKNIIEEPLAGCEETFMGVDITKELELIRYGHSEVALTLFIKDGKVIKHITEEGTTIHCQFNLGREIKIARELKIDGLLHVHNHPQYISAKPSIGDIVTDVNIYYGQPFKFAYSVVTEYDFWSSEQRTDGEDRLKSKNSPVYNRRIENNKTCDYKVETLKQHEESKKCEYKGIEYNEEIEIVPRFEKA